jgi:hypothetical protein
MGASTSVHNSADLPAPPTAKAVLPASLEINNKHVTNAQDVRQQGVPPGKEMLLGKSLGHISSLLSVS